MEKKKGGGVTVAKGYVEIYGFAAILDPVLYALGNASIPSGYGGCWLPMPCNGSVTEPKP